MMNAEPFILIIKTFLNMSIIIFSYNLFYIYPDNILFFELSFVKDEATAIFTGTLHLFVQN
jgi:hypothetical protein